MKITRKLLIPTLLMVSIGFIGLLLIQTFNDFQDSTAQEQNDLEFLNQALQSRLQAMESFAVALATETAQNEEVQAAFAAGDRERLTELTLPAYLALDQEFNIPQHQFHLPPATSFLRLHQLENFGDDLSGFRFTVLQANETKQPASGLEIGRGGLGMRGVVPVSYQGDHIGTVEFGLNVDQSFINDLKNQYNADWQILLSRKPAETATFAGAVAESTGPTDDLILQASTLSTPFFASASNYASALADKPSYSNNVRFDDVAYAFYSVPLYDFSGNIIGVVDIISDRTAIIQTQTNKMLTAVAVAIVSLFLVGSGLIYFITRALDPIQDITDMATAIAAGDLSRTVPVSSNDELGVLAQDFNTMAGNLRELIETLEQRVSQRTQALETTLQVSQSLTTILNQEQLISEVVGQVQSAFDYYLVQIYLLDATQNRLALAGSTGEAGQIMLARGHSLNLGQGLVGRAAATNKLVLVQDVEQELDWLPNPLLPDTRSEAGIPISFQAEVLGVLDVQHNRVNGLDEEQTRTLQAIAAQVAIALRNIRLYEEARGRAAREAQLNEIAQRIRSAADIDSVLRIAVKEIGQATRARRASVTLGQNPAENGRSDS